jgi:hypothetical protein
MMISTFWMNRMRPQNSIMIQNQLSRFMSDDSDDNLVKVTRKGLIVRVKKIKIFWNHYLSWFYVQQKSFRKPSFKKAIYKRNSESLSNIVNLANLALEEDEKWQLKF